MSGGKDGSRAGRVTPRALVDNIRYAWPVASIRGCSYSSTASPMNSSKSTAWSRWCSNAIDGSECHGCLDWYARVVVWNGFGVATCAMCECQPFTERPTHLTFNRLASPKGDRKYEAMSVDSTKVAGSKTAVMFPTRSALTKIAWNGLGKSELLINQPPLRLSDSTAVPFYSCC